MYYAPAAIADRGVLAPTFVASVVLLP